MSMMHAVHPDVLLRGLEGDRALREEPLQHQLLAHADHRVARPAHADVGDERRAARQEPLVGRLDVGVGPDDRRDLAVEVMAHRGLLARGLGVEVHEDGAAPLGLQRGDLRERGREGVVERLHEDAPLEVDHAQLAPVGRLDHLAAAAGGAGRVVGGAQEARVGRLEVWTDLALRPDVVAAREQVDLRRQDLVRGLGRDAQPVGGVLGVGHHQVRGEPGYEARDQPLHGLPAGLSEDVAEEEDFHVGYRAGGGGISPAGRLPVNAGSGACGRRSPGSRAGRRAAPWAASGPPARRSRARSGASGPGSASGSRRSSRHRAPA